jgi:FtsH-binding integral membrane protein
MLRGRSDREDLPIFLDLVNFFLYLLQFLAAAKKH